MATAQLVLRQTGKTRSADLVRINLSGTRYPVVKAAAMELGIIASDDSTNDSSVYWIDAAVPLEKFLELKSYQRINHFPGMGEISRKDSLARNMQRMKKENRCEYHFFPATWVLPADYCCLVRHMSSLRRHKKRKTFIVKPHNSSMGNGIYLTRSPDTISQSERVVVQEYLDKPLLLDGFKFDLRIYVLVTSCKPLRIFVFKDGLVRLSTEKYCPPSEANLEQCCMHLTNYSVNKHSGSFDSDEREDRGSKRTLRSFFSQLRTNGHNIVELWAKIHDAVIKTLLLAHPHLLHSYTVSRHGRVLDGKSQFFEILGFDILLDRSLQPWVLEVNRSPSFGTDTNLDLHVKTAVIRDALRLANISSSDKQKYVSVQREASRRRLIHSSSRTTRPFSGACNFQVEQAVAASEKERRRMEAKERLSQLRRERELEEFENENKGDYVRVYPSSDPIKTRLYLRLIDDSFNISSLGKSGGVQSCKSSRSTVGQSGKGCGSGCGYTVVGDMEEHELLDLLSEYEDEDGGTTHSSHSGFIRRPSTSSFQSPALQDSSPMGDMFKVMAARLHEEEQTQRMMVALKEMAPFYPGKSQTEVLSVLEQICDDFAAHRANIGSFWTVKLDNSGRKQLLAPVAESVKCLLHSHWRRLDLHGIRLHHITSQLMTFLLSKRGGGLWSIISPPEKGSWETSFKKTQETISVAELECCRRIAELSQSLLYCTYYYHCLKLKHSSLSCNLTSRTTSLPHLKRRPSLITPSVSRPFSHRPPSYPKTSTSHRHHIRLK